MYRNNIAQPLRLPQQMINEVEEISKYMDISKNDVYKMAIAMLINKFKGNKNVY